MADKKESKEAIAQPSEAVRAMRQHWTLIDDLLGGTDAMRAAAERYIPRRSTEAVGSEGAQYYDARLKLATLLPAFEESIARYTGRVFTESVQLEEVPQQMRDQILPDIDREGSNHEVFLRNTFFNALARGLSYVLVDTPSRVDAVSREQQKQARMQPFAMLLDHTNMLGWRVADGVLSMLRVKLNVEVDDGEYGTKSVEEIRVYRRNAPQNASVAESKASVDVQSFRRNANGEWTPVTQDPIRINVPSIPLVTFYTNRTGFMQAKPPLFELAQLNAKHWRMQASMDEFMDVGLVPILAGIGFDNSDNIVLGLRHAVRVPENGNLKFVEPTGAMVRLAKERLDNMKEDMRIAGAKLMGQQGGGSKTATEAREDAARENSVLGGMVTAFADATVALFDTLAMFINKEKGGRATYRPNLDPDMLPTESMQILNNMADSGRLSDRTVFEEAQRRGLVTDELDWEEEQVRINEQGDVGTPDPVLSLPGVVPPTPQDPQDPTQDPQNPEPQQ